MNKWPLPYYAVIFTSVLSENIAGYDEMFKKMFALVNQQSGFLGVESVRDKTGITISYWSSLEAIEKWRTNSAHILAKKNGKEQWYSQYDLKICKIII